MRPPVIRRIARRGGALRISMDFYERMRIEGEEWLKKILTTATTYTEHSRRKTLTHVDIAHALKRYGYTVYGDRI